MRLFKRRTAELGQVAIDRSAEFIATAILKIQRRFAVTFGKIAASWKIRHQWLFLYLICLVFGGLSVISILKTFNGKGKYLIARPDTIKASQIEKKNEIYSGRITDDEMYKVQNLKRFLDSILKTDDGQIKTKRFLKKHPGLLDSIDIVEKLYNSQKK